MPFEDLYDKPGLPVSLPGRTFGIYEDNENSSDDEFDASPLNHVVPSIDENISNEPQISNWSQPLSPPTVTSGGDIDSYRNLNIESIKSRLNAKALPEQDTFIPPPPREVLRHLLQKTQELHNDRYGEYLNLHSHDDLISSAVSLVQSKAWAVLCSGAYTLDK